MSELIKADDKGPCVGCEWFHFCRKTGEQCVAYRGYANLQGWKREAATPDSVAAANLDEAIISVLLEASKPLSVMEIIPKVGTFPNAVGMALKRLKQAGKVKSYKDRAHPDRRRWWAKRDAA